MTFFIVELLSLTIYIFAAFLSTLLSKIPFSNDHRSCNSSRLILPEDHYDLIYLHFCTYVILFHSNRPNRSLVSRHCALVCVLGSVELALQCCCSLLTFSAFELSLQHSEACQ